MQKGGDQSQADRRARPHDADAPRLELAWQRNAHELEPFGPGPRPVGHQRHAEPAVHHHGDRVERVELEALARHDARQPQVLVGLAAAPLVAVVADQRLGREQLVRVAAGQALRRQHHQRLFAQQLPAAGLGQREGGLQHDGRIELAVLHRAIEIGRVARLDEHLDLRELLDHARQDVRQHAGERVGAGAQAQLAGSGLVVGHGAQVGHVAQQVACALQDARAGLGDAHRAARARDQRSADLALQRADLLRHRRRCDVEQPRRRGHRAAVGDRNECVQELGVHALPRGRKATRHARPPLPARPRPPYRHGWSAPRASAAARETAGSRDSRSRCTAGSRSRGRSTGAPASSTRPRW